MARPTDKRWKGIIIDWPTIADMDANDYELKPLNQQQVAILLALLEYQKWPTRWTGLEMDKSELETYIADIEQRLMRNEGEGMATKDDIRDGMYEAMNRLAAQIVSGRYTNIVVGEDGTVSDPTTGGTSDAELPEDDPTSPIDETESARYGGDIEVAEKLETFISQVDTFYGPVNGTPVTSATDTKNMIGLLYPVDVPLMSDAIDAYFAYRATNARLLWAADATTAQYFYCNGFDKNAIARYFFTLGYTTQKYQIITNLVFALSELFFSHYYGIGIAKPSNQYLDAACVPMAYQEYLNVPYASTRNLSPVIAKAGHRLLIQVSGYYNDPDGDLQDAFWYRTAAGVLTRSNFTFSHGAGSNMPSDNQVVYNNSHVYEYTIDLFNGASSWSVTFNKNANMAVGSTSPTSGFTIKITDLGLAVSA